MNITRRNLLLGTVALDSQAAAPALRLAFSLYGMKSFPIGEAIEACKEIGYEGVEVCLLDGWPMDGLKQALAKTKLEVASFMEKLDGLASPTAQKTQLERLKKAADLSLSVNSRQPAVVESVVGGGWPKDWDQRKEYLVDRLLEWTGVMERRKVVLCVKAHVGSAVDMPEKLLWLHKRVNSAYLKLTYDYSHFQLMGLDPATTMKQLVPFTRFVHLKDAAGTAEAPKFLIPGDGMLDYKEHFRQLRKFGYRGWVVVEVCSQIHSRIDYNALRVARQCYERLRPFVG